MQWQETTHHYQFITTSSSTDEDAMYMHEMLCEVTIYTKEYDPLPSSSTYTQTDWELIMTISLCVLGEGR